MMGLSILIVDDSTFMRNMLKNLVVQAGGEVVGEAADGNEAVAMYNKLKPQLVLMDIVMPNKDGIEALKELRSIDKNARVVMCTSVGQDKIIAEATEAGAADFITKPFKPSDIKNLFTNMG